MGWVQDYCRPCGHTDCAFALILKIADDVFTFDNVFAFDNADDTFTFDNVFAFDINADNEFAFDNSFMPHFAHACMHLRIPCNKFDKVFEFAMHLQQI